MVLDGWKKDKNVAFHGLCDICDHFSSKNLEKLARNGKNSLVAKETSMVARDHEHFSWLLKNIVLYEIPLTHLKFPQ